MKKAIIFILISSLFSLILTEPIPTTNYGNKKILVEPDNYILYWDYNETDITFEIHAKTTGWVGFGISPNGEMENSNVIIFWMNSDGTANFTERNTNAGLVKPKINVEQKWTSLMTKSQDGYLISKSTRKIKQCDSTGEHIDIEKGTPHVIYAWSDQFSNGDIAYHQTNRSTRNLPLVSVLKSIDDQTYFDNLETTDFFVNVSIG